MSAAPPSEPVDIPASSGVGTLRGRLRAHSPGSPTRGAAVLCHPHPAFGGNMDVWLLPILAQALAEDGWSVLRFDFRSVRHGIDPMGHTNAHAAERDDIAAAVAYLRARSLLASGQRLSLVGWSFGALVALLYGLEDPAVTDWVGIAPATLSLPGLPMAPVPAAVKRWRTRRVVITGGYDQFFPPASMRRIAPHELHVLEHADHFFFDCDPEVAALVVTALARPEQLA